MQIFLNFGIHFFVDLKKQNDLFSLPGWILTGSKWIILHRTINKGQL